MRCQESSAGKLEVLTTTLVRGISLEKGIGMRDEISDSEARAKTIAAGILAAQTSEEAQALTREYVKTRYRIKDEDLSLDSFNALGQISIARSTGVELEDISIAEMSSRCEGTSASMTKKILLMIELNRELGLGISPEEAADITTLSLLAKRVSRAVPALNGVRFSP